MKLLIEIPDQMHERISVDTVSMREMQLLLMVIRQGQPLPEDCEILTKEAYSDLCLRASKNV